MQLSLFISRATISCVFCLCLLGCRSGHYSTENLLSPSSPSKQTTLFPWSSPYYAGGDGTSLERAVILKGTSVQFMARKAKKDWIKCHYPSGVIRNVHIQIVQSHVIQTIVLQMPSGEITRVYFDVTGVIVKPDLGAWFFVGDNGLEYAGMIDEEYFHESALPPWQQLVGTNSGTLIYQVDDEIGNGLFATGKLKHGKEHGVWHYERPVEGIMRKEY